LKTQDLLRSARIENEINELALLIRNSLNHLSGKQEDKKPGKHIKKKNFYQERFLFFSFSSKAFFMPSCLFWLPDKNDLPESEYAYMIISGG